MSEAQHILVVDDDNRIRDLLKTLIDFASGDLEPHYGPVDLVDLLSSAMKRVSTTPTSWWTRMLPIRGRAMRQSWR